MVASRTLVFLAAATAANAFMVQHQPALRRPASSAASAAPWRSTVRMMSFPGPSDSPDGGAEANLSQAQIEAIRLRAMAAKLRAEADALEAEQAVARAMEVEKIFKSFDANRDGVIEASELREGLQTLLKQSVAPDAAARLLAELDANKDGVLQPSELPGAAALARALDDVVSKQKDEAAAASLAAAKAAEIAARDAALAALVNDAPPTGADRVLGVLPYVLPLLDATAFGGYLLKPALEDGNPVVLFLVGLVGLFRLVPLSQFALFIGLGFLGDNLRVNKLMRHSALQAVYLDVALFPASALLALTTYAVSAASGSTGGVSPAPFLEYGSDVVFVAALAAIAYSAASTLLGVAPDKVPVVSKLVTQRLDRMSAREFQRRNRDDDDNGGPL